jgi:hypothetical protein
MPKKNSKPDYEDSKRNAFRKVKSGKLRQRENHERMTKQLGQLKKVLQSPSVHHWEAIGMAADTLANQPVGGLGSFLFPLGHVFFEPLQYCFAAVRSIEYYWETFINAVDGRDPKFAAALLQGGYEQCFRWLAFGHVQRLSTLYGEREEAVKTVQIWEDSEGKRTSVAVCNDGKSFIMPDDYFNEAPTVYFPGEKFVRPFHPDDLKRIENQPKHILVPSWPEPLKPRPTELLRQTLLVNVGLPEDLAPVFERMMLLPFPVDMARLKRK